MIALDFRLAVVPVPSWGKSVLAKEFGISRETVYAYLRSRHPEPPLPCGVPVLPVGQEALG
jgi:hypothetical protein